MSNSDDTEHVMKLCLLLLLLFFQCLDPMIYLLFRVLFSSFIVADRLIISETDHSSGTKEETAA